MRILVVSDSHGHAERLNEVVEKVAADHVIHCGDFCTKKHLLPTVPLTVVQGNCDFEEAEQEQIWETHDLKFYIIHGHQYDVKTSVLSLHNRAQEVGAHIVCFGHSHIPFCKQLHGILMVNPGSIVRPRGGLPPTYVCIELNEQQAHVTFYQVDGQLYPELGGVFTFE